MSASAAAALQPVFTFRLDHNIRGPAHLGKFDGIHVCLTAATSTDRVLIHSPHKRLGGSNATNGGGASNRIAWSDSNLDVALLNFSQEITALATGCMAAEPSDADGSASTVGDAGGGGQQQQLTAAKEVLVIGSPTHVLAYMVDDNSDLFYRDVPGGVWSLRVGRFAGRSAVLLGGADAVRAFDRAGAELFWLLVNGRVAAMTLLADDGGGGGSDQLVVGTAAGQLAVYRGAAEQTMAWECAESAAVTQLVALPPQTPSGGDGGGSGLQRFAYALGDGTLGVYEDGVRVWRVKSKHRVQAMHGYDLLSGGGGGGGATGDGVQLIVGWDSGKVDVRDVQTGDVLHRLPTMAQQKACIALASADYRGCGRADLIVCSGGGEVRGYERSRINLLAAAHRHPDQSAHQAELSRLMDRRKQLETELAHYETNNRLNKELRNSGDLPAAAAHSSHTAASTTAAGAVECSIIPANTRLQIAIYTSVDEPARPRIEIKVSTNNACVIRAVILFADGLFAGGAETSIAYPAGRGVPQIKIPLALPRDAVFDLHIKALVGHADSRQFHVFELTRQLPRFAMYAVLEDWLPTERRFAATAAAGRDRGPASFRRPQGWVRFELGGERWQRVMLWVNQNFLLTNDLEPDAAEEMREFRMYMVSLHDGTHLELRYAGGREVTLWAEQLAVAGEMVQSLGRFLNVGDLQTQAHYPGVEEEVRELFRRIEGLQQTYGQVSVDMAQKKNQERALVVRMEDARLYDEEALLGLCAQLRRLTEDLISTQRIRQTTFAEIQRSLEAINAILRASSRLRMGAPAAQMMQHLKEAVRTKNISAINKIISSGTN